MQKVCPPTAPPTDEGGDALMERMNFQQSSTAASSIIGASLVFVVSAISLSLTTTRLTVGATGGRWLPDAAGSEVHLASAALVHSSPAQIRAALCRVRARPLSRGLAGVSSTTSSCPLPFLSGSAIE